MSKREPFGTTKHGKSGRGGPSPRTKLRREMEANAARRGLPKPILVGSVWELFHRKKVR